MDAGSGIVLVHYASEFGITDFAPYLGKAVMEVPQFVEYVKAENAAAGMSRGLVERAEDWGKLIAQAQRILAEVQNDFARHRGEFRSEKLFDLDYSAPLVASARILDAASQMMSIEGERRWSLSLCAAAAFAMYGNFPSAHACIERVVGREQSITSRLWLAIGCFSPRALAKAKVSSISEGDDLVSSAIEKLQLYLVFPDGDDIAQVDELIVRSFAGCRTSLESLLLGYARIALRQIEVLSTVAALSRLTAVPSSVVSSLYNAEILTLLPTQFHVLCRTSLLSRAENALVCLPTSTGKTLIGELAIAAALGVKPGLAVYLAPYVALGTQAAAALGKHLPKEYRVHTLVGGLKPDDEIDPSSSREVIVATPERFDATLRRVGGMDSLRIVVVDEAHVVGDGTRGVRLEALLSRLRLQQLAGRDVRIVCLSGVMAHTERYQKWMGIPDELVIESLWRPTARRVAIWRANHKLTWLYAGDELRPESATSRTIFGTRPLVWPVRMYPASHVAQVRSQAPALYANAAFLCRQLHEEYQEPILCVCASRASSRGVAYRLAEDLDAFDAVPDDVMAALDFIEKSAKHLASLRKCLLSGVAYHNAALPFELKQLIEKAVQSHSLRVVCATTTLAEGVDLPFRVTVLAEWLQWRTDTRDQQRPFEPMKFRNIAGRCGRAGVFTEGDTVIFENVLGPDKYVDTQTRARSILSMLENPKEVSSALEEDVLSGEADARRSVLASNFLATIPENPDTESLERVLADHILARTLPNGKPALQLLEQIRDDVLSGDKSALAIAASPLKLTPLGEAARRSLFSPTTCRRLIEVLNKLPEKQDHAAVGAYLLRELASIPEQHNSDWSKVVTQSSSRFDLKPVHLEDVLRAWQLGVSMTEIFSGLPTVKKSKAADSVSEWLAGEITSETWAGRFDKFSDFVGSVVEEFLPWVLQACADFAEYTKGGATDYPWEEFTALVQEAIVARRKRDPTIEESP